MDEVPLVAAVGAVTFGWQIGGDGDDLGAVETNLASDELSGMAGGGALEFVGPGATTFAMELEDGEAAEEVTLLNDARSAGAFAHGRGSYRRPLSR